jgi:catechol 2,3-dioxygenase
MNPAPSLLAPSLHIQPSRLYVKDLFKVTKFYRDIVQLDTLEVTDSHVILGHDQTPVLELISKPEFLHAPMPSAGLFHNAIIYASRANLAETIYRILTRAPESYDGSADHLVSEAFYFHDPEYNGLELYFDRPRDTWHWDNGTIYLDPQAYILRYIEDTSPIKKAIGHVHLRVGDVPTTAAFPSWQPGSRRVMCSSRTSAAAYT